MSNYRLHYRKGDIDIQLESTDRKYVDEMFHKLLSMSGSTKLETDSHGKKPVPESYVKRTDQTGKAETGDDVVIDVAAIANKVHESDKHNEIEKNILHKTSVLARILLAFQFAHEAGYGDITTGDVEKITDQLGVKIKVSNVSGCIAANRKYFSSSETRQRGAIIHYKLNLQGKKAFEAFLAGQKPS